MATDKEYFMYIKEQLSDIDELSYRAMMGEYIIYSNKKVIGGIYDNRLLVKPLKSVLDYIKNPEYAIPYNGAKEMVLIDDIDDKEFLNGLLNAISEETGSGKIFYKRT